MSGGPVSTRHEGGVATTGPAADWLVWQLADSAFPTGGFAHSGGLEAAWQHGEVRNRDELYAFLDSALLQLGHASLPFVVAAYAEPERFAELDSLFDVFTSNHVANRASRLQGRALLASASRIFARPELAAVLEAGPSACGHFAPAFGMAARTLGIGKDAAVRLFFFQQLRALISGAVRLGIVGPMEGQALQHRIAPRAERVLERCLGLSLDDIAQTSPLFDVWQGAQDRLYSRLFQS